MDTASYRQRTMENTRCRWAELAGGQSSTGRMETALSSTLVGEKRSGLVSWSEAVGAAGRVQEAAQAGTTSSDGGIGGVRTCWLNVHIESYLSTNPELLKNCL